MKSDFMMALNQLSAERGLRKELVLDKVEVALATAFRRDRVAGFAESGGETQPEHRRHQHLSSPQRC